MADLVHLHACQVIRAFKILLGGKVDFVLPPELEEPKLEIHKAVNGLIIDLDYYTVAPVERAQWDSAAWITTAARTIKVGVDGVLNR